MKYLIIPLLLLSLNSFCSELVGVPKYNHRTKTYSKDQWDYYTDAINNNELEFNWKTAVFIYLISNVEIYYAHTDDTSLDELERIGVHIIFLRLRW